MTLESVEKLRELVKSFHSLKPRWDTLAAIDEVEHEIERDYMKLPVDADGVPIHVGDVMCSAGIREKGHKVIVSAIFEDGFVEYGSDNGLIGPLCQEDWVHAKPRTLTAEQVRECVQVVYFEGYSDGSVNRGQHLEETDWQAIADELNARAERTCRNTQSDFDFMCSECGKCVDNGRVIGINYCPNCGRKVVSE